MSASRRVWVQGGPAVTLGPAEFVARGGEGAVYVRGDVAYKLYDDLDRVIPADKLRELAAIGAPNVVRPEQLLVDRRGTPLGYTMRYVPDAVALCRLFPRTYRDRHGLTHADVLELVRRLQELVQATHDAGVLVVDLNELNYLVSTAHDAVYAIDVDSYQTAHYPATALMQSVRDPTVRDDAWSVLSDWFSFAVLAFSLFVGIHPYKGRHPTLKGFPARMAAHASVFDPAVAVPKAAYSLDVIPPAWRGWLRAVLQEGARTPPPTGPVAAVTLVQVPRSLGGTRLRIREILTLDADIRGFVAHRGREVAWTDRGVWVDGRRAGDALSGVLAVGFTPTRAQPVLARRVDGRLVLYDVARRAAIPVDLRADEVMGADGTVYVRSCGRILRVVLSDVGPRVLATTTLAATCAEHATQLFPGVAVQRLFDSTWVTLLPEPGRSHPVQLPELDGAVVVDARLDGGVLMVIAAVEGRYDRLVVRFSDRYDAHDVRRIRDVSPTGLSFTTLPTGVCVAVDEEERLELFSQRVGAAAIRRVEDPAVGADLRLLRWGGTVVFPRGAVLCSMEMT